MLQLRAGKEASRARAKAGSSVYLWPTLFATGNYGTSKILKKPGESTGDPMVDSIVEQLTESFSPSGWNRNWSVTVGATYHWGALSPVDPSHARADIEKSRSRQADLALERLIKNTRYDIQKGILKLNAAASTMLSQKENIKSAEESLRVAIIQFKNGVIDNTRLFDANVEETSAKTLYYQSLYDFQTAKAELNRAIGMEYFTFGKQPQETGE